MITSYSVPDRNIQLRVQKRWDAWQPHKVSPLFYMDTTLVFWSGPQILECGSWQPHSKAKWPSLFLKDTFYHKQWLHWSCLLMGIGGVGHHIAVVVLFSLWVVPVGLDIEVGRGGGVESESLTYGMPQQGSTISTLYIYIFTWGCF